MSKWGHYKQLEQVSTAALLEESSHLHLILRGVGVIALLVVAFIVWAAFTKIQETAVTYGELVPEGQVQAIQHLEGGIVQKVLVSNGDKVTKGQLLVTLNPVATEAELAQLQSREIALTINAERLRAFVNNQGPDLLSWSNAVIKSKYNTVKAPQEIEKLLADERNHLLQQNKNRTDQISVLQDMIAQREEKLKQAQNELKVWDEHIKLLTEEFGMYQKLKKSNLISHKDYLVVLREMNKARGERVRIESEIKQTTQAISEAKHKVSSINSELYEKAQKELGTINDTLLEVRHQIEKLQDKLQRMKIRAPVAGEIKGVRVFAGNVLKPGGLLMEIVPIGGPLVAESRIMPRDIGHVNVGDKVTVKVLTYDFARYGSINGKLSNISASTFTDENNKPYYKATTTLEHQYVGKGKSHQRLRAGMTIEASVITGEKTLLQYLLKPIQTTTQKAFRER